MTIRLIKLQCVIIKINTAAVLNVINGRINMINKINPDLSFDL